MYKNLPEFVFSDFIQGSIIFTLGQSSHLKVFAEFGYTLTIIMGEF